MRQISSTMATAFGAALLASAAATAQAEDEEAPLCEVRDSSELIHIALCEGAAPEALTDAALAEAGQAICEGEDICGVWFWQDAADMPATAPENHDGLSQAQVTSALGVWDDVDDRLVRISTE